MLLRKKFQLYIYCFYDMVSNMMSFEISVYVTKEEES